MSRHAPEAAAPTRALVTFGLMTTLILSLVAVAVAGPEPGQQAERVAVGDQAIDFTLESIDGESFRLSDLRGDKNAVIIFFRGTW